LKIRTSDGWWAAFVAQNGLVKEKETLYMPDDDAPDWFKPTDECCIWKYSNDFQGSRFIYDVITGDYYIYIIQL